MSGHEMKAKPFVPDLGAIFEELRESIKWRTGSLGSEATYYDSRIEEGGSEDWWIISEGSMKTATFLLTARGQVDVAADLRQGFEGLYAQGASLLAAAGGHGGWKAPPR